MNESAPASRLYGSEVPAEALRTAFTSGMVPVAVYGLGKMGLPLAAVYASVTGNTLGVDIDERVVQTINAGRSHIQREPGLDDLVAEVVTDRSLRATSDAHEAARTATVHVVMVPTLLTADERPDLSMLDAVVDTIATGLDPGDLVVVESTVPPRTCVDRVAPRLAAESGLAPRTFGVACCPERTVSGQALADIRGTHPKVVGGVDDKSTRAAALVYEEITTNDVITVQGTTTAEAVKVFEGVYRDVNIALANQLARYTEVLGIDVRDAIQVANTQPFCAIHDPGPGVGGHCIPVYPYFLSGAFEVDASLLSVARSVNDSMPRYTVDLVEAVLDVYGPPIEDATVLVLGVTYKENIAELRNAPAVPIVRTLAAAGAEVLAVDPLVDDWTRVGDVTALDLERATARDVDVVVLLTAHDDFRGLDWDRFGVPIVDGPGIVDPERTTQSVYAIGGGWPRW